MTMHPAKKMLIDEMLDDLAKDDAPPPPGELNITPDDLAEIRAGIWAAKNSKQRKPNTLRISPYAINRAIKFGVLPQLAEKLGGLTLIEDD